MTAVPSVVVTGTGLLTPAGSDPAAVLDAVTEGRCGASPVPGQATGLAVERVGVIADFDLARHYQVASFRRLMSRESALATVASRDALAGAGLCPGQDMPADRVALYAATGATALEFSHIARMVDASAGEDGRFDPRRFATEGLSRINPLLSFRILPNMPPCFLAIVHGIQGDNLVFNPWEGCGGQAVAEGFHALAEDRCDAALVGASDVKTHDQAFIFLTQVGLLPDDGSPPPTAPPAEGAAYLVLERLADARRRGRRPLARLAAVVEGADPAAGWGRSTSPDALLPLVEAAVARGGRPDLVIRSACGDPLSDEAEAEALRTVLGDDVPTLSPKLATGETYGAAGTVAAVVACAALGAGRASRVMVDAFGNGRERVVLIFEAVTE